MTPSVADTTSIPAKVYRRHKDPPSLWIAVVIGSVSLHLVAFWLIRSYQSSLLWQQQSKTPIPIEFVEVSAQKKAKAKPIARVKSVTSGAKPVTPKPPVKTQKLQTANLPKQVVPKDKLTVKPVPTTPDESAIALAKNQQKLEAQRQQKLEAQRQQKLEAQRQQELAAQRQQELAAQRQQELAAQRQQELAAQRQQQLAAQRQQQLAAQRQQQLEAQHQQQLEAQHQQQLEAQRQQQLEAQRQQENPGNTNSPPSPDAVGGSLIASLVGEPQQEQRDRHTHPANIKISNQPFSRSLRYIKVVAQKPGQPVELTVILTISEKGKLEKVAIAQPVISAEQKDEYETFLTEEVFNGWEFEPAYDNNPHDPKPSNLTVRIKIQPLP